MRRIPLRRDEYLVLGSWRTCLPEGNVRQRNLPNDLMLLMGQGRGMLGDLWGEIASQHTPTFRGSFRTALGVGGELFRYFSSTLLNRNHPSLKNK